MLQQFAQTDFDYCMRQTRDVAESILANFGFSIVGKLKLGREHPGRYICIQLLVDAEGARQHTWLRVLIGHFPPRPLRLPSIGSL